MTNSRSTGSRNRLLAIAVALCAVLGAGGVAEAGRKRVVVLDFEGPKGDKFHEDLVRLIKKSHTVVPTDKWNGTAEQLAAAAVSDKNVKKVARKLKIDAIVEGRIEKRRDEFIIRIKLRAGRSGELIGDTIDTKAEGPRIDGRAQRDLKDELVGAIDNVQSNHDSGDDAEDEEVAAPRKGKKTEVAEAEDEDKPVAKRGKKAAEAEDEPVAKKGKKGKAVDAEADEEPLAKKGKKGDKADKAVEKAAEDEDRPTKSGFSKHFDDERGGDKTEHRAKTAKADKAEDEDKLPPKKGAKADKAEDEDKLPPKKTAKVEPKVEDEDKLPPKKTAAAIKAEARVEPKVEPKPEPKVEPKPAAKVDDEDKLPPKKAAVVDDDDDKLPPKKGSKADARRGKGKKVASRGDDEAAEAEADTPGVRPDAETAVSPGERALDGVVGLSMTMRRMTFTISPTLRATPPGYKGTAVPGGIIDVTVFPLAIGHNRRDIYKDIGLQFVYDRVIKLTSKDTQTGMIYDTEEARWGLTGVFRHAFGSSARAPVVLGTLGYNRQRFNILGPVDIPDVKYTFIAPGAGIRFPVIPKLVVAADAKIMLITDTGPIQAPNQYGGASVFGYDLSGGVEYRITPNIFARGAFRFESISFTFAGTGFQTNQRDGMPMTQDVSAGKDTYIGGNLTVGYAY